MIRFNNSKLSKNKKLLVFISNSIRKIFGGDRLKRLSEIMISFSKQIYLKDKKKITILDFGCGSMEISKKLVKLSYVKQIIGVDTYPSKFKTKMKYIQYDTFFKKNKTTFDIVIAVDVLHHIGVDESYKVLKKLSKISKI